MKHPVKSVSQILRPVMLLGRYGWQRWMPKKTYADDLEDVAAEILLGGVSRFIDVGANDGTSCSNTALAAMHGARGLCFEPNPADYERLRGFYRWNRRIECIPVGLSERSGELQLRSDGLLSALTVTEDAGLTQLLAEHRRTDAPVVSIRVERLMDWLDRRPEFQTSDLLSLDVEGHELNVLRGTDWNRHSKPARCFVIETHGLGKERQWRHRDFDEIAALLDRQGYEKLAASRNNTIWLHREDRHESRLVAAKNRCPQYTWFSDEHPGQS